VDWLTQMFGTEGHVSVPQECARAALIFCYGLLLVRVAGRRIFGKWAALDIVVSIMVGSNLSRAVTGNAPLLGTMVASIVLVALHFALWHLAARSSLISRLVEGNAINLGEGGRLRPHVRELWALTKSDLDEALRKNGIDDVKDTRKVVLEPSGTVTVLKSSHAD